MFVRVHCSAVDVRKINSAPPFFGGGAKSGAASGGGAHFRKSQAENRDGKGLPVQTFLSTPETYKHFFIRPTRTNICRVSWAKHFAGQTFFRGGGGPLLAAARAPPDVCTSNVCTGLPLAEEGAMFNREMFVRVGCTRPVQTFAHKLGAPDPYKHSDEFRGPNICPKSLPVQTSWSKRFLGPKNVCTGLP